MERSQSNGRITGHLVRRDGARGSVWYAKCRLPHPKWIRLGDVWEGTGRPAGGALTERMAQEALNAILTHAREGDLPGLVKTGATVADACHEFLRFCEQIEKVDPTTIKDYRSAITNQLIPEFGALAPEDVTPGMVNQWKERLIAKGEVSNRTIVRYLTVLHGVFKRARSVYGLNTNPASADLVKRPRVTYTGEFDTYSREELDALVAAAESPQDGTLYLVAALTGLRQGELLALRWAAVDFVGGLLHVRRNYTDRTEKVPKAKKVRSVPMVPDVVDALAKLKERGYLAADDDLVFTSPTGGYLNHFNVRRAFQRTIKRAELRPIRFHDLRHMFGTMAIAKLDAYSVQAYMGHAHYSTTQRYLHHKPKAEDAAKLAEAFAAQPLMPLEAEDPVAQHRV